MRRRNPLHCLAVRTSLALALIQVDAGRSARADGVAAGNVAGGDVAAGDASAGVIPGGPGQPAAPIELTGRTMGTSYSVKYRAEASGAAHSPPLSPGPASPAQSLAPSSPRPPASDEVHRQVDALLAEIDRQMSNYRDDSEVARFNRLRGKEWHPVSAATAEVVAQTLALHGQTSGAVDVTLGPLSRLWRFGPEGGVPGKRYRAPTDNEIAAVKARCGAQHLSVRRDPPALRKEIIDLEIDLSCIAPGYAADAVAQRVCDLGYPHVLVDIGGEIMARGSRSEQEPWRVGVETPPGDERRFSRVVALADMALATSGDYRIFRTIGDVRYSHLLDPHTGRPLPYRGVAVTVLAATCAEADALATALMVLGESKAFAWCIEHEAAALFQVRGDNGAVDVRATPRFAAIVPDEQRP